MLPTAHACLVMAEVRQALAVAAEAAATATATLGSWSLAAGGGVRGESRRTTAAHSPRILFGDAAALNPLEPTKPVHTCPAGPETSSEIGCARFGHFQDLSAASRGAAEATTPTNRGAEAPRRHQSTR